MHLVVRSKLHCSSPHLIQLALVLHKSLKKNCLIYHSQCSVVSSFAYFFLLLFENDWDISSVSRLHSLTCKWLATSVLFPELLSFMLTHGCNLFIQTVFKWFSAAEKLFLWHQSTRNCTMSLQGQGVSVYHNYYPLFVSVLLTRCWVSPGKCIQTVLSALSDMSSDTRAALPTVHVCSIFPAQALVFSCSVTEHKGRGSPRSWVLLPAGVELPSLALQGLILLPSSVASHTLLCHPQLLDSRRGQVVPTPRLY